MNHCKNKERNKGERPVALSELRFEKGLFSKLLCELRFALFKFCAFQKPYADWMRVLCWQPLR